MTMMSEERLKKLREIYEAWEKEQTMKGAK